MNNLNLVGAINSLGYGITTYNIWYCLRQQINITLFPIGNINVEDHWDQNAILNDIKNQHDYNPQSPSLKIWHPHDLLMKPHGRGKYCTYSFFEIDKISNSERVGYNTSDIIITPTHWAKDILVTNNINPNKIYVANPGIDTTIFNPNVTIDKSNSTDDYVFINIGKWEIRKGHDILVHLFNQAFSDNDNVRLIMINTNPFLSDKENKQWQQLYKNSKLGHKIYCIPRLSSQLDIAKIIAVSDCGIYPARAEGWNNEIVEMMAMNKPIIATNYSAHTEYLNKKNGYLINIQNHEPAEDGKFFNGSGYWAKLDADVFEQAIQHMRYVYKNNIKTNLAGLETAKQLTWQNTATKLKHIIYE